jgi:hypothetical protein
MRYALIVIIILLLAGCTAETPVTIESPYTINDLYYYLQAVSDLETRGVLDANNAAAQREFYLDAAEVITGQRLTEPQLADYLFSNEGQSWLRFLNFINLIWVFASIIIVLSSVWIFAKYILPLLKRVPVIVYEILLYALCAGFIFGGLSVESGIRQFVALPGVLGLFFLLPFSYARHIARVDKRYKAEYMPEPSAPVEALPTLPPEVVEAQFAAEQARHAAQNKHELSRIRRDFMILNGILIIIWGAIAIAYGSVLIGFLTVLAFMGAITLSPLVPPLVSALGFKRYDPGATALVVSFALVLVFLVMKIAAVQGIYAAVFEPGVFWIGADVYFIALGVLASRFYHRDNRARFIRWQLISIASCVAALFIGSFWDIPVIQEIAGTYFLFYILEKYVELPNWRKRWAWALLGLGLLLYAAALVMNEYPQFFLLQ